MSVPRRDIQHRVYQLEGGEKILPFFSKTLSKLMTKELSIWCMMYIVFPTPTRVFHTSVFHRWMTIYRKIPPIYTWWMNVCSIYQAHRCVKDVVTHLWWGFFSKKIPNSFSIFLEWGCVTPEFWNNGMSTIFKKKSKKSKFNAIRCKPVIRQRNTST